MPGDELPGMSLHIFSETGIHNLFAMIVHRELVLKITAYSVEQILSFVYKRSGNQVFLGVLIGRGIVLLHNRDRAGKPH